MSGHVSRTSEGSQGSIPGHPPAPALSLCLPWCLLQPQGSLGWLSPLLGGGTSVPPDPLVPAPPQAPEEPRHRPEDPEADGRGADRHPVTSPPCPPPRDPPPTPWGHECGGSQGGRGVLPLPPPPILCWLWGAVTPNKERSSCQGRPLWGGKVGVLNVWVPYGGDVGDPDFWVLGDRPNAGRGVGIGGPKRLGSPLVSWAGGGRGGCSYLRGSGRHGCPSPEGKLRLGAGGCQGVSPYRGPGAPVP